MGAALVPIAAPTGPSLLLLRRLSPHGRTLLTFPSVPRQSAWEPVFVFPCLAWPAYGVWVGEGGSFFLGSIISYR